MIELKNPLEIYKILPQTNCGHCGVPSCMAFAASVLQGMKALRGCPYLKKNVLDQYAQITRRRSMDDEHMEVIRQLQQKVHSLDFSIIAPRIGARLIDDKLAVNCLGKDFFIDQTGEMSSSCHVNHWLYVPVLHYILECQGKEPKNDWIPFGELPGAAEWSQYFSHRCEGALQQIADAHRELLFEILFLFGAQTMSTAGNADHSLLIMPLPKVPFLINYWQPDNEFPSELNILLDRSAAHNINAHSITLLARGIVEMFRQLIVSHSKAGKLF
ncbi:MAG: DUF3786 domain-containing protein [Desulfoarculaceae bacterium]|nr:DUF3786 domain-containing protein [Desulfoarculaceae bacterium]